MDEGSFRLRINYRKAGRLRFLSHLEVVRALERTIRRAALPYAVSQGFNVHMKHAFGPALPVGTAGLDEYLDIWLRAYLPPHEVMERLQAVCVCGLPVIGAAYVPASDKAL
ncbi:MAG: TIGR03936 family radical SAM-associated protein, partial [Coriobacteriales bacterium]|nr:TIGR03936 family radical SAM-associated protein [Coriobacteriales bacterium]